MYSFISGTIEEKKEDSVVINNNGIGYEIFLSTTSVNMLGNIGETAKIYTYLYVREDCFLLYGFLNLKEKNLFLNLITVSGIGSKMALTIMSSLKYETIVNAIATNDSDLLAQAKGVGKKTAERIVLELKNKIGNLNIFINASEDDNTILTKYNEAVAFLVYMGLNKYEATNLVKDVAKNDDTTESIIQKALKSLNK